MSSAHKNPAITTERIFKRFSTGQRLEHWALLISFGLLLLTGLPQKYRATSWSQQILSTPERVALIQTIHHYAAILLIILVLYHLANAVYRMSKKNLTSDMFVSWKDFRDAGQMLAYLLFLRKDRPRYGKYSFEEKITYWFLFFGIGIMVISGLILWFPEIVTRLLPGSTIPAAKLAHSTEAVVAGLFIVIWHFYHVHFERLNLSIFTGKMNEEDMKTYHSMEHERLTGKKARKTGEGRP
ncbi:MAG: cytochrome b/b6 domain-containing protein [Anaerolineales bacterium]|nr:cytochrome b/b6 domain-containing protein [Anaerolineales bacterium]